MPGSHGCCQNTRASVRNAVLSTDEHAFGSNTAKFLVITIAPMALKGSLFVKPLVPFEFVGCSPPQSPLASVSVLRI